MEEDREQAYMKVKVLLKVELKLLLLNLLVRKVMWRREGGEVSGESDDIYGREASQGGGRER